MQFEQVRDAANPAEMRAEIFRLKHHHPLVHAAMEAAHHNRCSAEDQFVMLAYLAIKTLTEDQRFLLERAKAATELITTNYAAPLEAYMAKVIDREGVSFVEAMDYGKTPRLDEAQTAQLLAIEAKVRAYAG